MTRKIIIIRHTNSYGGGDEEMEVLGHFTSRARAQEFLANLEAAGIGDCSTPDELYSDNDFYKVLEIDFATLEMDPELNVEDVW